MTIGLKSDGGKVVSVSKDLGIGHAEHIAPTFQALCEDAEVDPGSLKRIGVTVGPGSFMGQRVGIAFAKGLKLGSGAETVALTTLEAMAETVGYPSSIAIDARRGQVYTQGFNERGVPREEARLLSYEEAATWLRAQGGRLVGSGVSAADPSLNAAGSQVPSARALLSLTEQRNPSPLRTIYLRAPDAKPPKRPAL